MSNLKTYYPKLDFQKVDQHTGGKWLIHGTKRRKTISCIAMMTSPNGNIFRVNSPLCGEVTGHRWIPLREASDAELWFFLWSAPE